MSLGFFVHAIFSFFIVLDKLSKYVRQYSNERLNAAFYRFPVQLKYIIKQIWTEALCLYFFLLFSQLDLRKCVFLRTSQMMDDEWIHHDMF